MKGRETCFSRDERIQRHRNRIELEQRVIEAERRRLLG